MEFNITLDLHSGWVLICVAALLSAMAVLLWYRKKGSQKYK
jgi:Mg2+ and Co2+ transporter CorA